MLAINAGWFHFTMVPLNIPTTVSWVKFNRSVLSISGMLYASETDLQYQNAVKTLVKCDLRSESQQRKNIHRTAIFNPKSRNVR